jgi:hypothetical protein
MVPVGNVVLFPALKPRKALAEYRLKVTHYADRVEVEPEGLDDSIDNREIVRQLLERAAWRLEM